MKRLTLLLAALSIVLMGCQSPAEQAAKVGITSEITQKYIGKFNHPISVYKGFGDQLSIQKELEKSFEIYSIDMTKPILLYDYTTRIQDRLLYCQQLDRERTLLVKQTGNGEENNILQLEGKKTKTLATRIAYSENALVTISPSRKLVVYCMSGDELNPYGLFIYNIEADKSISLTAAVSEAMLNDLEGSICWSPTEEYVLVDNRYVYNTTEGNQAAEINSIGAFWSNSGSKLAYIKADKGYGKSVHVFDLNNKKHEEAFIANYGEYLAGSLVWNQQESMLAFTTGLIEELNANGGIIRTSAIYSLSLNTREAVRIDTALGLSTREVSKLEGLQYNAEGRLLTVAVTNNFGSNLAVFDHTTGNYEYFLNIEYLHHEANEDYVCSGSDDLYFVQGQCIVSLDENMNSKVIYKSLYALEDLYVSRDGRAMIIVERTERGTILKLLKSF